MKVLVACRIFEDELRTCLAGEGDVRVVWLEAALHADLDRLEKMLRQTLEKLPKTSSETSILFGLGCHPEIPEMAERLGAKVPSYKNCLHWLLGDEIHRLEKNRTMLMTPAWVRQWPDIMEALGWTDIDARMQLGRYDRILVVDPRIQSLTDEEILAFFDRVQVPVEVLPVDLTPFCRRLKIFMGSSD